MVFKSLQAGYNAAQPSLPGDTMTESLFERRCAARHSTKTFVDYEIVASDGTTSGRGLARTLNLSATGVLLESGQFFDAGQPLRLTAVLANDLVQITGRVVHSQPISDELCCSGVQFLDLSGSARQAFQHYCASLNNSPPSS